MLKGRIHNILNFTVRSLAFAGLMQLAIACSGAKVPDSIVIPTNTVTTGVISSGSSGATVPSGPLEYSVSAPTTVIAGATAEIVLLVTDSKGNPGRISSMSAGASGGTSLGTFGAIYSPTVGKYILPYTGKRAGTANNIQLIINTKALDTSNPVTVVPGTPALIGVTSGDAQAAQVSTNLATNPVLQVTDTQGNPVPNAPIHYVVSAGGGSFNGSSTDAVLNTDANGQIAVPWTMGAAFGTNTITVSANSGAVTGTMSAYGYDKPSTLVVVPSPTPNQVKVSWAAPTYTGGGTMTYTVQRALYPAGPYTVLATGLPTLSFFDTTPLQATTYYYQVIANNTYLDSTPSTPVAANALFNQIWALKAGTSGQYSVSDTTRIDFTATTCELTASGQVDIASTDFSGAATGIVYNTLSDLIQTGMKLGNAGSCNGTTTNCVIAALPQSYEMNANWAPKWSNLIGYWKLNDAAGSTTAVDSSPVGTNTGTVSTGVTLGTAGKLLGSAAFAGGKISINTITSVPTDAMTISAWVKMNSTAGYSAVLVGTSFRFEIAGAGLNFSTTGGGGTTGNYISAGTWTHVAISRAAGGNPTTYYINGIGVATAATGTLAAITGLTIGTNDRNALGGGDNMNGTADEVALWNTALTTADISTIYATQAVKYAGMYTSRVFDGLSAGQSWTSLNWGTTLPFGKPLPDQAASESAGAYTSLTNSSLMTGIVSLWHLDEPAGTTGANSIKDSSGQNHHLTPNNVTMGVNGKFNKGVLASAGYLSTTFPQTNTMSISVWASGDPNNHMLWSTSASTTGPDLFTSGNRISLNYNGDGTSNVYAGGCTYPTNLADGQLHHYVTIFDKVANNSTLYIDGIFCGTAAYRTPTGTFLLSVNSSYFWAGYIDEAAIWSRVLSATEIQQLYQRGVSRAKFQIRSCTLANCSDGSWKGPDGTAYTFFSELNNTATQSVTPSGNLLATAPNIVFPSAYTSPIAAGRYVQYRMVLESDTATTTFMPEVRSVSIGPTHYDSTSPYLTTITSVPFANLMNMLDTATITCPGGVTYNISPDNTTWYWWNGSAWVATVNGKDPTTSNSATVLNTGAPNPISLYQKAPKFMYVRAFLKSNGSTACSLTNFQINGN